MRGLIEQSPDPGSRIPVTYRRPERRCTSRRARVLGRRPVGIRARAGRERPHTSYSPHGHSLRSPHSRPDPGVPGRPESVHILHILRSAGLAPWPHNVRRRLGRRRGWRRPGPAPGSGRARCGPVPGSRRAQQRWHGSEQLDFFEVFFFGVF